jgi:hypothetical protein
MAPVMLAYVIVTQAMNWMQMENAQLSVARELIVQMAIVWLEFVIATLGMSWIPQENAL